MPSGPFNVTVAVAVQVRTTLGVVALMSDSEI